MKKNIVWVGLYLLITIVSSGGCGSSSGGSEPDTMAVTISSPQGIATTTTYTEGSYSTNSAGNSFLNPNLNAYITASSENNIELHYWDGVSLGTTVVIVMHVNGNTPGIYPVDPGYVNSSIMYSSNGKSYDNLNSSTSGTITLSNVGNVGDKITGTLDAIVSVVTDTSDTLRISGSFSITRDN